MAGGAPLATAASGGGGTATPTGAPYPYSNLLPNPLEGTPWMPAGNPFQEQFAHAPITLLNQMVAQPVGARGSGPSAVGQNPLAAAGIGSAAPTGQQGTNLTNYAGVWQGAQQEPWWSAFGNTPGVPTELKNPKYSTLPSNFADMWGFQNPSLLPMLTLMASRPISPAQMRVPPVQVPHPLAPVIQPGNPAPPALGRGHGGGGGEGGGEGGGDTGLGGDFNISFTAPFWSDANKLIGPKSSFKKTANIVAGGTPQEAYQGSASNEEEARRQAQTIANNTTSPVTVILPPAAPGQPPRVEQFISHQFIEHGNQ